MLGSWQKGKRRIAGGGMKNELGNRITLAIKHCKNQTGAKMSWSKLAIQAGCAPQASTRWKVGVISKEKIEEIAKITGVSSSWLFTGNGSMTDQNSNSTFSSNDSCSLEETEGANMIKFFSALHLGDLQNKITAYHNMINNRAMDWVMTSCSITSHNGEICAAVIFNSKHLGDAP